MAFLEIKDLYFSIRSKPVLTGLNLSADQGEIIGIRGENGSGKSSLLKILASVLKKDSGFLSLSGLTNPQSKAWKKQVAWVPQDPALDDRLSVQDNLKYWGALSHFPRKEVKVYIQRALKDPLIKDFTDLKVKDLSGGMRQRASLMCSLFLPASLILLDEPFVGADEESQILMQDKILDLKSEGKLVILVSHEKGHLASISDRKFHLINGKLEAND